MSIEESGRIDIIATRPGSNEVRLIITDHLPWTDEAKHLLMLQEKINNYISFIESGQLSNVSAPAIPADPQVTIVVAAPHVPTENAKAFFRRVESILDETQISFLFELRRE